MNSKIANIVVNKNDLWNSSLIKLKKDVILMECGFLSNSKERIRLQTKEHQLKIAKSIAKGIVEYF